MLLKYGFNSNWDVLFIDSSRIKIIVIPILFDIAGYLLMTIPYFFWDYDDDKQNKVMEVLRRREEVTRKKYNEEHGIVPKTIIKGVRDVIEITSKKDKGEKPIKKMSRKEREEMIVRLTAEMKAAAKILEFEHAAYLRDKINKLREGK